MKELLNSKFAELHDLHYEEFRQRVLTIDQSRISVYIPKSVEVEVYDHEAIIRTKSATITLNIDGEIHTVIF